MPKKFFHRLWLLRRVPFVRNLTKLQMGTMLIAIIGLLSSVVQTRMLGLDGYGTLAVAAAFAGLLSFFNSLGQEVTLSIFLSEAIGRKDTSAIRTVMRYFLQTTLISMLIIVILVIVAPFLGGWMTGSRLIGIYAGVLIFNSALQGPTLLYYLLLQLTGRVGTMTIFEGAQDIAQFLLMVLLLFLGFNIWAVLLSTIIPSLVYFPICIRLYERDCTMKGLPSLWETGRGLFQSGTGTYVRQGLWITLDKSVANNIYPNIFFMVLNATAGKEVVGLFRLALRLASMPISLFLPSVNRLATVQVPLIIGRSTKAARDASVKLIKGTVGLSIFMMIGAAICIPPLLPIVYGKAFTPATMGFLIMLPLNFFSASAIVTTPLLRLLKRTYLSLINTASGVGIGVAIYFLLYTVIQPLIAVSLGVLYSFAQVILLHLYVWRLIKQRQLMPAT